MSEPVSALNVLVDSILPEDLRDPHRVYDSKGISHLMTEVAKRYPQLYPKISKTLGDIGRKQAWSRGETFTREDFKPVIDREKIFAQLDAEEAKVNRIPDPREREDARLDLYARYSDRISRETNTAALARRNNIAITVLTGARGKEAQLRDLLSTPGFYTDNKGRAVPWFIRNSYAEGVRPTDYLAASYGARDSVVGSKRATAKGGFLAKTLSRATATHVISEHDCGTSNGIDLPLDEPDLRGRVLQRSAAGYPAGTVLDRKVLADLRHKGAKGVIVRSPLTCGAEHGICSKCWGVTAEGRFPKVGKHVGIHSSTALGEPLTQAALSMKHVTSGKGKAKEFSGLDYIIQFMESPEEFKDRATVSTVPGRVEKIEEAPQGGSYVHVDGKPHYVPTEREITVTPGEPVEAGDSLTDGLVDAEDILKHKGLGEARRYWSDRVSQMAGASGAAMDRRQFEMLARAIVDHVELDEPEADGFLPDDKVRLSRYVHRRSLPEKTLAVRPKDAVGKWLEQDALHHTVGTRITPSIADHLATNGFDTIHVTDKEPAFHPVFVRLQQVAATDDDWLASLGGSYLGNQLGEGIMRAQDTNIESNRHPVPRLAVGVGYGDKLQQTGKF